MATPILRVDGSVSGAGTADEARSDLQNGETVTITDIEAANSGATYLFTLLYQPVGTSNGLITPTANPCTLVLDGTGTWWVECDADGAKTLIEFAVRTANAGLRKPAFDEELQFNEGGNAIGWSPGLEEVIDQVDANAGITPGGAGSDTTAIHDDTAGEINAIAEKVVPASADLLIIEDSAAANAKKKVQIGNLPSPPATDADAIHDNVAGEIAAITQKSPVVAADHLIIEDSAAANAKKRAQVADLRITESQITDLTHSDPDAIHDNVAGEINAIAAKATLVAADQLLVEDSAAANAKKKALVSALRITESQITDLTHNDAAAIHNNVASEISALSNKTSPVSADLLLIEDSEAGNIKKRIEVGNLPGGSSGPLAAAQGAYLECTNTAGQSGINGGAPGTAIQFDTAKQQGDLVFDNATDEFRQLQPGRTYLCIGSWRITAGSYLECRWYDETGASWIGEAALATLSGNEHATCMAVVTPTVETTVRLRAQATSGAATIDAAGSVYGLVMEIGAVQAEVIGGLEFMDIIEVGGATASVTFGSGGDGVLGRALDGDVDEEYVISWYLPPTPAGTTHLLMRPNGVSTNQSTARMAGGSTFNPAFGDGSSDLRLFGTSSSRFGAGTATLRAKTGLPRTFHNESVFGVLGGETVSAQQAGQWNETGTNVTSLDIVTPQGSNINPGARFVLWRRTRNNLRADTAGIYERQAQAVVAQGSNAAVVYALGGAIFGGSAVGLGIDLLDDTVSSGSITVELKVAGSVVLTATLDATNNAFHRAADVVGANPIAFGDAITVEVSTTSLVTAGAGTPTVLVNATLINNAYVQAPIGPHYLYGRLSVNQTTNLGASTHIEFDTFKQNGDSIVPSSGTGQQLGLITLQPGKTYEMHAYVRGEVNEGYLSCRWFDHGSELPIVDDAGLDSPNLFTQDNRVTDATDSSALMCLFTPTVETVVKLEMPANLNPTSVNAASTHIMIKELK